MRRPELLVFFFSSRSRHTSWTGDWSSDVCSSDLHRHEGMTQTQLAAALELSVPTVGNLVHRLVARGWIEIRIDPAHRLNKYLYLLPPARPPLRQVHQLAHKV